MPRHDRNRFHGKGEVKMYQPSSKGGKRKSGIGTYAKKKKFIKADRYDRPYLTGKYSEPLDSSYNVRMRPEWLPSDPL